jgi:hypothetical protein
MYADDCKIFREISCDNDMRKLQEDIHNFNEWCVENKLEVNASKCFQITFSRSKQESERIYDLGGNRLNSSYCAKDLGVVFNSKMNYNEHLNQIISSANKVLEFIRRFSKDFSDPWIIKVLYCSLARPHVEYCSVVWNPSNAGEVERIESIQRKFTKLL